MKLVHIDGRRIVNLDALAAAKFTSEHKAFKPVYSEIDNREHPVEYVEPDCLELWFMAPEDSGFNASAAFSFKVSGQDAIDLWNYLEARCDIPSINCEP